jgi:hypothetical protein
MVGKMEIGGVGNWGKQISRELALHAGSAGYVVLLYNGVRLVGSTWENETSPSSGKTTQTRGAEGPTCGAR